MRADVMTLAILGVFLVSSRPALAEPVSFLPPADVSWTAHAPPATVDPAFFARERWTRAALTAALGPPMKGQDTWAWLEVEEGASPDGSRVATLLRLDMEWRPDDRARSARLSRMPLPLVAAMSAKDVAAMKRQVGFLDRPRSLFFEAFVSGSTLSDVFSTLGPPSEAGVDFYKWIMIGPTESLRVNVSVDSTLRVQDGASWLWTDPPFIENPDPATGPMPHDRFALRARTGAVSSSNSYLIEDLWPAAVRPGDSQAAVMKRLGVPLDATLVESWTYPGLTVDFVAGRVSGLALKSRIAAHLLALPMNARLSLPEQVARLGVPTARLDREWSWRYEGPAGVVEIHLRPDAEQRWSWTPTRQCDLELPLDGRARAGAMMPIAGDTRGSRLLEGLPNAGAQETWLRCLEARVGKVQALDGTRDPVGWRTRSLAAPALRAQLASVPALATLGEPRATWVERFGPPSFEAPGTLGWIFPVLDGETSSELEVSAQSVFGDGHFDELAVRSFATPLSALVNGLSLRRLEAGTAALGPSDRPTRPTAERSWRAGAVRFDPRAGVMTFDGRKGVAALRDWLAQRGVKGGMFEVLGAGILEAKARLPAPGRVEWKGEGLRYVYADDTASVEVALCCGGPAMRCERIEIGPAQTKLDDQR